MEELIKEEERKVYIGYDEVIAVMPKTKEAVKIVDENFQFGRIMPVSAFNSVFNFKEHKSNESGSVVDSAFLYDVANLFFKVGERVKITTYKNFPLIFESHSLKVGIAPIVKTEELSEIDKILEAKAIVH